MEYFYMKIKDLFESEEKYKTVEGVHSSGELNSNGKKNCRLEIFCGNRRIGFVENVWSGDTEEWMFYHPLSTTEGCGYATKEQAIKDIKNIDEKTCLDCCDK